MKKSAATLDSLQTNIETIAKTLECMQVNMGVMQVDMSVMQVNMSVIQVDMGVMQVKVDDIHVNMNDIQSNVEFLVKHAVMKEDVRQIVQEEIAPVESRLLAAIDAIAHKQERFEGEVLAHDYRISSLERSVGLPL